MNTSNILFFLAEHHRWDWLGSNSQIPVRTPTLDRMAREGTVFGQCRCNSPLCAPSRACLATGLRYHRAGVPDNRTDLDPEQPTFMKELRRAGYRVAVCGKTDLHKKSHLHGITGWSRRLGRLGFTDAIDMCGKRDGALTEGREEPIEPYMNWLHTLGLAEVVCQDLERRMDRDMDPVGSGWGIDTRPFPLERQYQIDDFCGRRAIGLLEDLSPGQPWFLQVNWASAHPPFDAAEDLLQRYRGTDFPCPADSQDGVSNHQAVRRQYAAMLEGMDEWMGRIIEVVDERGEREDTVIVYSADHGEMLGDHGLWNKGRPYEPAVHVPLIFRGPDVLEDVRSDALVELIDLAATFLDVAGVDVPETWDARSLIPVLRGAAETHRELTVSELQGWRMAFDGRFKYVEGWGDRPLLYDLEEDPDECCDALASHHAPATRLREGMAEESDGLPCNDDQS